MRKQEEEESRDAPVLLWSRCSSSEKHPPMGDRPKIAPFPPARPYSRLPIARLRPDPRPPHQPRNSPPVPLPLPLPPAARCFRPPEPREGGRKGGSGAPPARIRRRNFRCALESLFLLFSRRGEEKRRRGLAVPEGRFRINK
jgi:hypothetical protein